MNCANHPERQAIAFCQNCGKPLCSDCTRSHHGLVVCEPCLLLVGGAAAASPSQGEGRPAGSPPVPASPSGSAPGSAPGTGSGNVPGSAPAWSRVAPEATPYPPTVAYPPSPASPVLAGFLGLIPGVGAMYNGQFIKALLHVVVFIVLIGASEHFDLAGLLVAAWVFYQVFDAAQTASARRYGRPLPDPFGILDMSHRLGPQGGSTGRVPPPYAAPGTAPYAASYTVSGEASGTASAWQSSAGAPPFASPAAGAPPSAGNAPGWAATQTGGPAPGAQGAYAPVGAPGPIPVPATRRSEPIGAIVLILVGLLLLMSTLGVLDMEWIYRGWPVLILLVGVWMLYRRLSAPAPYTPPPPSPNTTSSQAAPSSVTGAGSAQNPLSISPDRPVPAHREEEQP